MRTANRKREAVSTHHQYNGVWYELVSGSEKYSYYPQILDGIIKQLEVSLSIHKRVFVIRFDLHQKDHYTNDSKSVTTFFDRLKKRLSTKYKGLSNIGFVWVREKEKATAQHYHAAVMLDYDLVNTAWTSSEIIRAIWESIDPERNSVHIVRKTHSVVNELSKAIAVQHLSYLSKSRGKGYRPPQNKDYGMSRLKGTSSK